MIPLYFWGPKKKKTYNRVWESTWLFGKNLDKNLAKEASIKASLARLFKLPKVDKCCS